METLSLQRIADNYVTQKNERNAKNRRRNEQRHITECTTEWQIYLAKYRLDPHQPRPVDADWSGAEIKSCCRLAALLDVPLVEAAGNIVPVAKTAAESVEKLRQWASGRCLSADQPGIYTGTGSGQIAKPGRKVRRDASMN